MIHDTWYMIQDNDNIKIELEKKVYWWHNVLSFLTIEQWNKGRIYISGGFSVLVVIVIGFGISALVIYEEGQAAKTTKGACGIVPSEITNLKLKDEVFTWKWHYFHTGHDLHFYQECPTLQHNIAFYVGNKLAARSQGRFFDFKSTTDVLDCHGNYNW